VTNLAIWLTGTLLSCLAGLGPWYGFLPGCKKNSGERGRVFRAESDHKIHVFKISDNHLKLDPRFNLGFNRAISPGPERTCCDQSGGGSFNHSDRGFNIELRVAGDTDRLANCVAAADMASAAAKSRNAGVSSAKTTAIIARQLPEALKGKLKATVADVYSHYEHTPDELAAKTLQECFESDVL